MALTNQTLVPTMPAYPAELLPPHDLQNATALYNGMVYPLHPFGFAAPSGIRAKRTWARAVICRAHEGVGRGWRQVWNQPGFPVLFRANRPVNYGDNAFKRLPELWEAQAAAAREIPNTGMAVINDIGNLADIHPKNKQEVGRRLALLALANTYGQTNVVFNGPSFKNLTLDGNTLRVEFRPCRRRLGQPRWPTARRFRNH